MNPLSIMQGVGALISPISQLFLARKQRRLAAEINANRPDYQVSKFAQDNLGTAKNLTAGRMAGAGYAAQNIRNNAADAFQNIARGATSGSQMLAAAAAANGMADESDVNLATQEAQNERQNANLLMDANRDMTLEHTKQYQDKLDKFNQLYQLKSGLQGAAMQNSMGALGDIGNGLMMAGGMLGKSQPGSTGAGYTPWKMNQIGVNPDGSPHFG